MNATDFKRQIADLGRRYGTDSSKVLTKKERETATRWVVGTVDEAGRFTAHYVVFSHEAAEARAEFLCSRFTMIREVTPQ